LKTYKTLKTKSGNLIAYSKNTVNDRNKKHGVIFLGGFKSDMTGTKAKFLDKWAFKTKTPFLRFDYSGHGKSSGDFIDGCISEWLEDAIEVFDELSVGPQVLVGSSMGGWIAFLLAKERAKRVKGLVGIAAAPDFTENSISKSIDSEMQIKMDLEGQIELVSEYSEEPYIITQKLLDDGRKNLILPQKLNFNFPIRLLQGMLDTDVPFSEAIRLMESIVNTDMQLRILKGADHSFSSPECLSIITETIELLLQENR
jgi:pimeloyl-ACP methyl ester carboxylesterase